MGNKEVSQLSLPQHFHLSDGSQAVDNHFQPQQGRTHRGISTNPEMGYFSDELPIPSNIDADALSRLPMEVQVKESVSNVVAQN